MTNVSEYENRSEIGNLSESCSNERSSSSLEIENEITYNESERQINNFNEEVNKNESERVITVENGQICENPNEISLENEIKDKVDEDYENDDKIEDNSKNLEEYNEEESLKQLNFGIPQNFITGDNIYQIDGQLVLCISEGQYPKYIPLQQITYNQNPINYPYYQAIQPGELYPNGNYIETRKTEVQNQSKKTKKKNSDQNFKIEKVKEDEMGQSENCEKQNFGSLQNNGSDDKKYKKKENNYINLLLSSLEKLTKGGLLDTNDEDSDSYQQVDEKNRKYSKDLKNESQISDNYLSKKKFGEDSCKKSLLSKEEFNGKRKKNKKAKLHCKKMKMKGKSAANSTERISEPPIFNTKLAPVSNQLIPKTHRKCGNVVCSVVSPKQTTPLNRWTKFKLNNGDIIFLCTLCTEAFANNQYCYYCYSIYSNEIHDGKQWIECDYCRLWHHSTCEEMYGNFKDISKLILDKSYKYKCPVCFKNEKNNEEKARKNLSSAKKEKVSKQLKIKPIKIEKVVESDLSLRRSGRINNKEKVIDNNTLKNVMLGNKRKCNRGNRVADDKKNSSDNSSQSGSHTSNEHKFKI